MNSTVQSPNTLSKTPVFFLSIATVAMAVLVIVLSVAVNQKNQNRNAALSTLLSGTRPTQGPNMLDNDKKTKPVLTDLPNLPQSGGDTTVTPIAEITITPTETEVPTVVVTSIPSPTPTHIVTPFPTTTHVPPPTFTPMPTYTPIPTFTPMPTYTPVPTFTPIPTYTPSPVVTPTPTITPVSTVTVTPTISVTPSNTPTVTPTMMPTETPIPTVSPTPSMTVTPTPSTTPAGFNTTIKVYVLAYNPVMANGQTIYVKNGWTDPHTLNDQIKSFFRGVTHDGLNYEIVNYNEVNDFTTFTDGSKYDETTYNACRSNPANCWLDPNNNNSLRMIDYPKMLSDNNICSLVNSNQVDEVWLWGAGYFGFYEAVQAGTGAFWTNGPAVTGTACDRIVGIMGLNVEVGVDLAIHSFGHRMEGTIIRAYTNNITVQSDDNAWLYFFRSGFDFPNIPVGCGNIHLTPNSTGGYSYGDQGTKDTYCADYANYPNISYSTQSIDCTAWGCDQIGYLNWWFSHIPVNPGRDSHNKFNNWWNYFIYPETITTDEDKLSQMSGQSISGQWFIGQWFDSIKQIIHIWMFQKDGPGFYYL